MLLLVQLLLLLLQVAEIVYNHTTITIIIIIIIIIYFPSGIDTAHPLFQGRAVLGIDLVDSTPPDNGDPNGHGTNMAGMYE